MLKQTQHVIPEVEKSEFCQGVIRQRIAEGLADAAPILDDVASCNMDMEVHGFLAGFPCQGISRAGSGKGLSDGRTGLVVHLWRLYDQQKVPPQLCQHKFSFVHILKAKPQCCKSLHGSLLNNTFAQEIPAT